MKGQNINYCKINTQKQAMPMPNPIKIQFANPNDRQKELIAELDNWLEMVYTEQPSYNPETQYLTQEWNEINGKAVQSWVIHEIEPTENNIEA